MKKLIKITAIIVGLCIVVILIRMNDLAKDSIPTYEEALSPSPNYSQTNNFQSPYVDAVATTDIPAALVPTDTIDYADNSSNITAIDCSIIYSPEDYDNTRMSYMDYRTITDETSEQYQLQQYAHTDETGIRMVGNRFCIAIGQEYTSEKGRYIDIVLKNGIRIPCILADCKAYCDTIDGEGFVGADGGLVEFVVDTDYLPEMVQLMGSNEYQFDGLWQSPVAYVVVYDNKFVFD